MLRSISLGIILFLFWLALSGLYYNVFLTTVGLITSISVVLLARRMGADDGEGHPIHLGVRSLAYFPWLAWEIMKSAWSVTRVILDPRLPISPTMTRVRSTQRTAVGIATYANSITLTPGTITTDVSGHNLTVHALVSDGADDLEAGGMDAKVTGFEGTG